MTTDRLTTPPSFPHRRVASDIMHAAADARRGFVSRALCMAIALTLLTLSLFGLAGVAGFWPDSSKTLVSERTGLLEMIAISATHAASRGDEAAIEALARDLARGSSRIRSVAVRRETGETVFQSPTHPARWTDAPPDGSTLTHARLRIFSGDQRWGMIELTFDPQTTSILGVQVHPQVRGMVLSGLSAFLIFWILAHLALRKLNAPGKAPDRIQRVLDAMTEAVVLLDADENVIIANEAFGSLAQRAPGTVAGMSLRALAWKNESGDAELLWSQTLKDGQTRTRRRLTLTHNDGSIRIVSAAAAAIIGTRGKQVGVLLTLDDITVLEEQTAENAALLAQVARTSEELQARNDELQVLATTDALTGCLNRRALFDHFHRAWAQADRGNRPVGCIMVDVDHFKKINDQHGHAAGDAVLRDIGQRLRDLARAGDIVGRYGGEEFCIIVPDGDLPSTWALAERIRHAIEALPCGELAATVSLGVAAFNTVASTPEALVTQADNALYAAKRAGRNRVAVDDQRPHLRAA